MEAYRLFKNQQGSDSDGWYEWPEKITIAHYASLVTVKIAIDMLIAADLKAWDEWAEKSKAKYGMDSDNRYRQNLADNIIGLADGCGGSKTHENYPIYDYELYTINP